MRYAKISEGVVVQTQPNEDNGFVEYDETEINVIVGMLYDGDNFTIPVTTVSKVLANRLTDVSDLFYSKISGGFPFDDPQQNPQVFEYSDSSLKWLDRAALRARKSIDDVENKTFKMRVTGGHIVLTDVELLGIASGFYDSGTDLDDVGQDHKDALHDIADGVGTDDEKRTALNNYDIETGW